MKKPKKQSGGGGDGWMATYADMVTLLMTFFIVLLSMSSTDEAKFNAFVKSFSSLPQEQIEEILGNSEQEEDGEVSVTSNLDELYFALQQYITQNNQDEYIEISKIDDVIYIRFSSALFFEPDRYILRQESIPILDFIGDGLTQYESAIRMVNVLGFTATVPNGSYWMLSGQRASVVATHFTENSRFPTDKMTVLGYGNRYPVASNDSEEGMKKNRRVELIIVGDESEEGFDISDALGQYYNPELYPAMGESTDAYMPGTPSPDEVVTNKPEVFGPPSPQITGETEQVTSESNEVSQ